jgi:hypothetical protein
MLIPLQALCVLNLAKLELRPTPGDWFLTKSCPQAGEFDKIHFIAAGQNIRAGGRASSYSPRIVRLFTTE